MMIATGVGTNNLVLRGFESTTKAETTSEFTISERRLLVIFYSNTVNDTIVALRQAFADMTDPDERTTTERLIMKLTSASNSCLDDAILGSEGLYGGR